jgi:hypothetical protein
LAAGALPGQYFVAEGCDPSIGAGRNHAILEQLLKARRLAF